MNGFRPEYIRAAIQNEANRVACAATSTRNDALNKASFNLASLGVPGGEIIHSLRPAALQSGLKNREIYSTINSGMRAGRRNPRSAPANGWKGLESNTTPNHAVETAPTGILERRRPNASSFLSCDAPHKFKVASDDGPSRLDGELRRHVYKCAGRPVRVKIKLERHGEKGFQSWYAVTRDGVAGWQAQKPAQYVSVPYVGSLNPFDSELTSDALMWPEGEKDVDTLTGMDVPAFTFGGVGDGLPGDIESYLKDRHLVILADNDQAGRDHAEKKAALAHSMGAASIKIVHFPELPEKNDVSDFIEGGGTAEQLVDRAAKALLWRPDASASNGESDAETLEIDDRSETDAKITRLAKLNPVQYDRVREAEAKHLGCRIATLDALVKQERGEGLSTRGQGRPIELPDPQPWPTPVDGVSLITCLTNTIREYVVITDAQADAIALWSIHTHAHDASDVSPKLILKSVQKRSGKTRLVGVLARITAKPFSISGITSAALLRIIEMFAPTLLLDEIDAAMNQSREMAEALRGLINSGFDRAGARFVMNVPTAEGGFEPRQFSTWSPQLLAGIGELPDTVRDRSIEIEMSRKRPDERVKRLRRKDGADLHDLCRKSQRWAEDNLENLRNTMPEIPPGMNDRAADAWEPLFAIADLAGGDWPQRSRRAALALSGDDVVEDENEGTILFSDIRDEFIMPQIKSEDLVKALVAIEGHPWAEFGRDRKPITPNRLARLLKPYKIKPRTIRIGTGPKDTAKGYKLEQFADVFARYLPVPLTQTVTSSQPNKDGHYDASPSVTLDHDVTASKASHLNNDGHCDGVTVSTPHSPDSEWIDL